MATQTKLNTLFLKQKKAIRIVSNADYRAHTDPLFKIANVLPLHKLITFSKLKFMHRYINNKQPFSFTGMWNTNYQLNPNRQLRNANDFFVHWHRIELFKRSPLVSFAKTWNECKLISKMDHRERPFMKELKRNLLGV
jgi:hypothetical protein